LMLMLRTRAKEKQNARVAQTVISNTDVNPLKFLATTNEALAALVVPRGPGYLAPDDAINGAFRDLADHQVRSWVAIQSALRRMIDRFDPAAVERDLEELGMLESLLSGGRNAKLWKLYTDRYKDIARAAEDRFLGEVGADFRDAYEGNREKTNDN
jgi:type VI secretion system protein ImpI